MTNMQGVDAHKKSSCVHFDWLTMVFPMPDVYGLQGKTQREYIIDDVLQGLGIHLQWLDLMHGLYNYEHAMCAGDNSIICGWYDDTTIVHDFMLQLSGQGVETIESILLGKGQTIASFIKQAVNDYHVTFSRVDACLDLFNYSTRYSARYVGEEAKRGNLVTRASRVRLVHTFDAKGCRDDDRAYIGASEGYTTYIGTNPKQLRVYNKLAERASKVNKLYQVDSWSRWEFQLNGKQAMLFMSAYYASGYDLVQTWIDWLASNYRWIVRTGHHQAKRSRYPNAKWFDELIKNAKRDIHLRETKQKPTFEHSLSWIDRQVMPTLSNLYMTHVYNYKRNGVSDDDAHRLALKQLQQDIMERVTNDEVNWPLVNRWLAEN